MARNPPQRVPRAGRGTREELDRRIAAREDLPGLDSGQNVSSLALDGFPSFYAYSKE